MTSPRSVQELAAQALASPAVITEKALREERRPIHELFKRHSGSASRLSREKGFSRSLVTGYFAGRENSPRVEAAILELAEKLIALEHKRAALSGKLQTQSDNPRAA